MTLPKPKTDTCSCTWEPDEWSTEVDTERWAAAPAFYDSALDLIHCGDCGSITMCATGWHRVKFVAGPCAGDITDAQCEAALGGAFPRGELLDCLWGCRLGAPAYDGTPLTERKANLLVESRLLDVLVEHPMLTDCGYGVSSYDDISNCSQANLIKDKDDIVRCVRWLTRKSRQSARDFCTTTYGLKHRMEDDTDRYVGNGEMIAAFLLLGLPIELDGFNPRVRVYA